MSDITCRISRSNRPCLVCPGRMDLIEASPRYTLFTGLPLCNSESIDCLDCPECGFSTTSADYQYLHMCKKQRYGIFYSPLHQGKDLPTRKSLNYTFDSLTDDKSLHGHECSSCHVILLIGWKYCPHCGRTNEHVASGFVRTSPSSSSIINQRCNDDSRLSLDSGIVRMVTPPKLTGATDIDGNDIATRISL